MTSVVLTLWPLIAVLICMNRPVHVGVIWATIPPYLLLPEATSVYLPGLPDLNKTTVIALGLILGLFVVRKDDTEPSAKDILVARSIQTFLLAGIFISAVFTFLANPEPVRFGPTVLPGLSWWEGISFMSDLFVLFFPFMLARKYLADTEAVNHLLFALAISALCYTVLMLLEMRLSPQLHRIVYGYHQHQFAQHVRDGYRPMVFLQHGLWVGFYTFTGLIAALALWRDGFGKKWLIAAVWLFVMLFFSRNFGAFVIAAFLIGLWMSLGRKMTVVAAAGIAITILIYPALRQAHVIPIDSILDVIGSIDRNRMLSLGFRLDNEDALLARAAEKPLVGWAGWGRQHVYNEFGQRLSISEGRWTQTIGATGWIGYIFFFGLLTCPAFILFARRAAEGLPPATYAFLIITTGNLIYMIPNSTLTPVGMLVFGALAGLVQKRFSAPDEKPAAEQDEAATPATRYTRFPSKSLPARGGVQAAKRT